jgi:hypothetical protein
VFAYDTLSKIAWRGTMGVGLSDSYQLSLKSNMFIAMRNIAPYSLDTIDCLRAYCSCSAKWSSRELLVLFTLDNSFLVEAVSLAFILTKLVCQLSLYSKILP